jgi:hypothetical protein
MSSKDMGSLKALRKIFNPEYLFSEGRMFFPKMSCFETTSFKVKPFLLTRGTISAPLKAGKMIALRVREFL